MAPLATLLSSVDFIIVEIFGIRGESYFHAEPIATNVLFMYLERVFLSNAKFHLFQEIYG